VAIYDDGTVRLSDWGKDITPSSHLIAWRQNGPLIIQDGQINPHTAVNDPQVWAIQPMEEPPQAGLPWGSVRTGTILYYAVGFNLTLSTLTRAVQDAGAFQAIQLDINNYYTHFEAFMPGSNNQVTGCAALDQMKGPDDHRYLTSTNAIFSCNHEIK